MVKGRLRGRIGHMNSLKSLVILVAVRVRLKIK